jgi:hypothetical protein
MACEFAYPAMQLLDYGGRRLSPIRLAGRLQGFAHDAFLNCFVRRRETSRIEALPHNAGDAVQVPSHSVSNINCVPT